MTNDAVFAQFIKITIRLDQTPENRLLKEKFRAYAALEGLTLTGCYEKIMKAYVYARSDNLAHRKIVDT